MKKPPAIVFIVGPTAVGKSAVAAELAGPLSGEIVSCDAMQVYREVSVASDKPPADARARVAHHLLDVVSVEEEFNVARYRTLAIDAIRDIQARGKAPLVVGGSGMYMMALLDGLFESGEVAPQVRAALEGRPLRELYVELQRVDPAAAAKIAPGDRKRIVRALEVFQTTGVPISEQQKSRKGLWGEQDIRIFGLERPREELYRRVEARVEGMFAAGLVDEVKGLLKKRLSLTGAYIIGLPEIKGALEGEYDLVRARELIKQHTRNYVKRQMTWFRRDKRIEWIMIGADETARDVAEKILGMLCPRTAS